MVPPGFRTLFRDAGAPTPAPSLILISRAPNGHATVARNVTHSVASSSSPQGQGRACAMAIGRRRTREVSWQVPHSGAAVFPLGSGQYGSCPSSLSLRIVQVKNASERSAEQTEASSDPVCVKAHLPMVKLPLLMFETISGSPKYQKAHWGGRSRNE